MKVYISADIEGIGCVVRQEQSSPGGREYAWARRMMTEEVKRGIGAYAALCQAPAVSRARIYEGAKRALSRPDRWPLLHLEGAVTLAVRFTTASAVDRVLRMPGTERVDGVTVRFAGRDLLEAFMAFDTMADLVSLVASI